MKKKKKVSFLSLSLFFPRSDFYTHRCDNANKLVTEADRDYLQFARACLSDASAPAQFAKRENCLLLSTTKLEQCAHPVFFIPYPTTRASRSNSSSSSNNPSGNIVPFGKFPTQIHARITHAAVLSFPQNLCRRR